MPSLFSVYNKQNTPENTSYLIDQATGKCAVGIMGHVMLVDSAGAELGGLEAGATATGNTYIGKPSNGDFVTAYNAATEIVVSGLPSGVSALTDEDIEMIRQIDNTGLVVEEYTRDEVAISIAGTTITVAGATFAATDSFVIVTNIPRTSDGTSGVGGGDMIYSNSSGNFTATITDATKNITITGLPFTLETKHVIPGMIKREDSSGNVELVPLTNVSVSGGVITLSDMGSNFVTGDKVVVLLVGPSKAYDIGQDETKVSSSTESYFHRTGVEHLIDESNLGLDGAHDGLDNAAILTDTSEVYTPETVAEGYTIYNVTDASSALIDADSLHGLAGDGGAGNPTADDITHAALAGGTEDDWDIGDVASIPECKRFEIPMDTYKFMTIDALLDSQDANNSCYLKVYATLDENADVTDDTYWKDVSTDVLGAAQLSADGIGGGARVVTQGLYFIDNPSAVAKYMIKIIAECDNGVQNNEFDVRIKKYY